MIGVGQLVEKMPPEDVLDVTYICHEAATILLRQTVDLVEFGAQLGLKAVPHDRSGTLVWDVKPASSGEAVDSRARSQTAAEFPIHTDASFEAIPPHFFILQTLYPDRFGGGGQSFVELNDVLSNLSEADIEALSNQLYTWTVPPEFRKDHSTIDLPVLFAANDETPGIRYRSECIHSRDDAELDNALQNLRHAIDKSRTYTNLPQPNQIILVDNWRVLHARSAVLDPYRHLQRIRFE